MEITVDENRLKALVKSAMIELLQERRELVQDAVEEALEDIALARAIEEGRNTPEVSREEIFRVLAAGK